MKIAEINGYQIHVPTSGGKAGKGHNRTSTIQVRKDGSIVKSFRFTVASQPSRLDAIRKAKTFVTKSTGSDCGVPNQRTTLGTDLNRQPRIKERYAIIPRAFWQGVTACQKLWR